MILRILGLTATVLTGKMTHSKRLKSLTKFKANEKNILVATDVASRGLDIPRLKFLNYNCLL